MPAQEEGGEYPVRETEEELSQPASLSESRDQIHRALLNPFTAENSSQSQDRSAKLSKEKRLYVWLHVNGAWTRYQRG